MAGDVPVDATRIPVTSSEELARLRRQVLYGLAVDSPVPTIAFLCVHCGSVIGFTDPTQRLNVRDVDCPECGTYNVVRAA